MKKYYVNKNSDSNPGNNHEVHAEGCRWMPMSENRQYLGEFSSAVEAVQMAEIFYQNVDGCATCCPECHHQ